MLITGNRHFVSTAHPPSVTRIATGVRLNLLILHDHLLGCPWLSLVVLSTENSRFLLSVDDLIIIIVWKFFYLLRLDRGTSSVWRNPCSSPPAVALRQLELICHTTFTNLVTIFFFLLTRTGFWDSPFFLLNGPNTQITILPFVGTGLSNMIPPGLYDEIEAITSRVLSLHREISDSEVSLGQYICELVFGVLVFGVDEFDLNFSESKLIRSNNQSKAKWDFWRLLPI